MRNRTNERPILFTPVMAEKVFDGSKTQTRRLVKPQPDSLKFLGRCGALVPYRIAEEVSDMPGVRVNRPIACPYGVPGDRLWVRESWADIGSGDRHEFIHRGDPVWDGQAARIWRPSIHMPRAACRSELEIVAVRVERVRDIGKDGRVAHDVLAEGITRDQIDHLQKFFHPDDSPALAYREVWNAINGKDSWDANPWVWVIEFRKTLPS